MMMYNTQLEYQMSQSGKVNNYREVYGLVATLTCHLEQRL